MRVPLQLGSLRGRLAHRVPTRLNRPRCAAVAVILSGAEHDPELLLVRRSERLGDPWSGHMALPGGHRELQDADLQATALRETFEEVGLDLGRAELLGQLDDITPIRDSEIAVSPFVFWVGPRTPLNFSEEVSEAHWVKVNALADGSLRAVRQVSTGERTFDVSAYIIEERVVWGMTFRVLGSMLSLFEVPA